MGPFPIGRRQLKFLVVAMDYFTKWVEAEPLATIIEKNIQNFVWKKWYAGSKYREYLCLTMENSSTTQDSDNSPKS